MPKEEREETDGLTPKREKSIAITTTVNTHAMNATIAPRMDPITPAPMLRAKARNAIAHAIGCRIITSVNPSTLSAAALLNTVPSQSIQKQLSATIAAPSPLLHTHPHHQSINQHRSECLTINRAHHVRRLVPHALRVAVVLVRLRGRHVEHAVPERAERDARVPDVARVCEGHF